MKETAGTAAEKGTEDCSQTKDRKNGEHSGTKAERVPQLGEAGKVEKEVRTTEALPELCLVFAETAL